MKRNKRKVPGGCIGVAGWERLEGCWLDRGPGCAAGRGERSADERVRRTAEEVAGWNRGIMESRERGITGAGRALGTQGRDTGRLRGERK